MTIHVADFKILVIAPPFQPGLIAIGNPPVTLYVIRSSNRSGSQQCDNFIFGLPQHSPKDFFVILTQEWRRRERLRMRLGKGLRKIVDRRTGNTSGAQFFEPEVTSLCPQYFAQALVDPCSIFMRPW